VTTSVVSTTDRLGPPSDETEALSPNLDEDELLELGEAEATLRFDAYTDAANINASIALADIEQHKLYRGGYATFADYRQQSVELYASLAQYRKDRQAL
jgi:hypothetical protein